MFNNLYTKKNRIRFILIKKNDFENIHNLLMAQKSTYIDALKLLYKYKLRVMAD